MKKELRKAFKLTDTAEKMLKINIAALKTGIKSVCELHTHDSNPSMSQEDFEKLYIEKVLGAPISAVSASIRKLVEDLSKQKEDAFFSQTKSDKTEDEKNEKI